MVEVVLPFERHALLNERRLLSEKLAQRDRGAAVDQVDRATEQRIGNPLVVRYGIHAKSPSIVALPGNFL